MSKVTECALCEGAVSPDSKGVLRCTVCLSRVLTDENKADIEDKQEKEIKEPVIKSRKKIPREEPFNFTIDDGSPIFLGIDPGARYTGVLARQNDAVLHSSTIVRVGDMEPLDWAREVVVRLRPISALFPEAIVGIETVTPPTGFAGGKRAPLNPKHIINAAAVAGAVALEWAEAYIILPRGNGSQHTSHYPDELTGRRPKDLPGEAKGAGTRGHERSAYDVAGKTQLQYYEDGKNDE